MYKERLLSVYSEAQTEVSYSHKLDKNTLENINIIADNCFIQKGVYTVFVTLAIYKLLHPEQDIRNHQSQISEGFSGRSIDTQYITPTLKALGLPSMAESGWLTRSLEQPYPYTLNYDGKISNKKVKNAFLELIDAIETKNSNPQYILVELLRRVIKIQNENIITITPLKNPERLTINRLTELLDRQFSFPYETFGGAKLPVIAFYAMYKIIIKEVVRYKDCYLKPLSSHTACDRTSKSSGDIEIFKDSKLFEAIEIKLDKKIDTNTLRIAIEKIIRYNPDRYYILSYIGVEHSEATGINDMIKKIKKEHGCQIVINGLVPTLKYYMRLISDLGKFLELYTKMLQDDSELKTIHKYKCKEFLLELQNEL